MVIGGLFGDRKLSGWWKLVSAVGYFFVLFVTALAQVIASGKGMADRREDGATRDRNAAESYIRSVAVLSPSSEIAMA